MSKTFRLGIAAAALLFVGAGCMQPATQPQSPSAPAPAPAPAPAVNEPVATHPNVVLVSTAETTAFCDGAKMDSDGYRKTITAEQSFTPAPPYASEAEKIRSVLSASTTGMCKTAVTTGNVVVTDGVAHMPPIDAWAGVSITMCSCRPQVEVNLLRLPGITSVVWDSTR